MNINMTPLEITLSIALWIVIGFFIAFKRNWYRHETMDGPQIHTIFSVVFAPLNLAITLVKIFCINDWKNE